MRTCILACVRACVHASVGRLVGDWLRKKIRKRSSARSRDLRYRSWKKSRWRICGQGWPRIPEQRRGRTRRKWAVETMPKPPPVMKLLPIRLCLPSQTVASSMTEVLVAARPRRVVLSTPGRLISLQSPLGEVAPTTTPSKKFAPSSNGSSRGYKRGGSVDEKKLKQSRRNANERSTGCASRTKHF